MQTFYYWYLRTTKLEKNWEWNGLKVQEELEVVMRAQMLQSFHHAIFHYLDIDRQWSSWLASSQSNRPFICPWTLIHSSCNSFITYWSIVRGNHAAFFLEPTSPSMHIKMVEKPFYAPSSSSYLAIFPKCSWKRYASEKEQTNKELLNFKHLAS